MLLDTNKALAYYKITPVSSSSGKTQYKCPLHNEQNGHSFTVFEDGGWYCFGKCGKGGDAIAFIAAMENLPYGLARQKAEEIYGVKLGPYDGKKEKYAHLYKVNNEMAAVYHAELAKHPDIIAYLEKRGFTAERRERWQIGFALDEHVKGDPSKFELYAEAGLMHKSDVYSPMFNKRIVFPIRDLSGDVIGFTGRIDPFMPKEYASKTGKYKNTPTTPIFQKGEVVFGLYELVKAKLDAYPGVGITEGAFDAALCQEYGVPAVAFLGLGSNSMVPIEFLLQRFKHNVVLMLDGDEAGYKRAFTLAPKLFEILEKSPSERLAVAFVPEGQDPDELLLEKGGAAGLEILKQSVPIEEYAVRKIIGEVKSQPTVADRRSFLYANFEKVLHALPRTVAASYYDLIFSETGVDVYGRYYNRPVWNTPNRNAAQYMAAGALRPKSSLTPGEQRLRDKYYPVYLVKTTPTLLEIANQYLKLCDLPALSFFAVEDGGQVEQDWASIREEFAAKYRKLVLTEKTISCKTLPELNALVAKLDKLAEIVAQPLNAVDSEAVTPTLAPALQASESESGEGEPDQAPAEAETPQKPLTGDDYWAALEAASLDESGIYEATDGPQDY